MAEPEKPVGNWKKSLGPIIYKVATIAAAAALGALATWLGVAQ